MPEPQALTMKKTAATSSSVRRPNLSARRPAKKAPTAQPSSIEATLKPVPTLSDWKACWRPSTVPLMTPLSKPNRKPPMAATQQMSRTTMGCCEALDIGIVELRWRVDEGPGAARDQSQPASTQ
jgi:hypothetical protein